MLLAPLPHRLGVQDLRQCTRRALPAGRRGRCRLFLSRMADLKRDARADGHKARAACSAILDRIRHRSLSIGSYVAPVSPKPRNAFAFSDVTA